MFFNQIEFIRRVSLFLDISGRGFWAAIGPGSDFDLTRKIVRRIFYLFTITSRDSLYLHVSLFSLYNYLFYISMTGLVNELMVG